MRINLFFNIHVNLRNPNPDNALRLTQFSGEAILL